MNKKQNTDYLNVVNPFICKSISEIRISPNKDPRKEYDENKNIIVEGKENKYLYNPSNPNITYTIGSGEEQEIIDIDKYDYEIPAEILNEKRKDGKKLHKEGLPLSFIQIDNEKDGISWYKKHYSKIPDDLLPIIARYHWGEPITKKGIKNEKKKILKKAQKDGLKVLTKKDNEDNPFLLNFD